MELPKDSKQKKERNYTSIPSAKKQVQSRLQIGCTKILIWTKNCNPPQELSKGTTDNPCHKQFPLSFTKAFWIYST